MAFSDRALIRITGPAMFWVFLIILTLTLAWVHVKYPPSVLSQVLNGTEQERTLRNLQDPLAMRLWVIGEMSFMGEVDSKAKAVESVIKQWSEEVKDLKEKAYSTKAADMSWSLKGLDLTEDQKKAVKEINKLPEVQAGAPVKPGW